MRHVAFLALTAFLVSGAAVAAEDKWEVTTNMQMTGMPFMMPATTTTVCMPQNQPINEKMVPAKDNCKVTKFTTTGATSKFHMECAPPQQMSGDGEFTSLGKDAYKGTVSAKGNFDGHNADIKMTYTGKKVGVCGDEAANPYAAMMKQSQAAMGMACTQYIEGMIYQMADAMAGMCPDLKTKICVKAKGILDGAAASPQKMLELQEQRNDWKDLANYCGMDGNAIAMKSCATAKKAQDWNAAVLVCGDDPELEAIAKQQCVGMKFTGRGANPALKPLCEKYADVIPQPASNSAAASAPASTGNLLKSASDAVDTGNSAVDTGARAVEGYKKLKGLFGR